MRRFALVGALGALALLVTACTSSGGSGPTFTPPTSTYQPPTQSTSLAPTTPPVSTGPNVRPGEKPPTFDSALNVNKPAGAISFAQYWMETIDWGYATTDATLARAAFSTACTDCARFMKIFDDARANGVHFRGGRTNVLGADLRTNDHHNGATAVVDVPVAVGALEAVDAKNKVVETDPAEPHVVYRVWLRWTGSHWTVVDTKQGV